MDLVGSEPTYIDYAGIGGSSSSMTPSGLDVLVHMPALNKLEMKATMTYEGEGAAAFRQMMDEDGNGDGTVSADEVSAFEDEMIDEEDTNPSETNVTLDGKDPVDLTSVYSIDGAEGAVDSTSNMKIVMRISLTFPDVEDKDTHEITFEEPFGDDFMDIDDLLGFEMDISFRLRAPDGWDLASGDLPSKMKDYINDDGDEVVLEGEDLQNDWNTTFANLQTFTIEKSDESPGFGLVLALGATLLLAVVAGRRRR